MIATTDIRRDGATRSLLTVILLVVGCAAWPVYSAPARAVLSLRNGSASSDRVGVKISALRVTESGRVGETRVAAECLAPGDCTLDLEPGIWLLTGDDPQFFFIPQSITVGAGGAATATLAVSRTTAISGTVAGAAATEAVMRFRPSDVDDHSSENQLPCTLHGERWSCLIPSGRWDLVFRVPGYASHYFPAVVVTEAPLNLGTLRMTKGASLVGRVDLAFREPPPGRTLVVLRPAGDLPATESEAALHSGYADAKGFFHLAGLKPGEYQVQASRSPFRSEDRPVTIVGNREAVLRDPLVVAEPTTLTLRIGSADPGETPWLVELFRLTPGRSESYGQRRAAAGSVSFKVYPGTYELGVKDESGSTWASREVEIGRVPVDEAVFISRRAVEGHVRLGCRGIAASLTLQNAESRSRISVTSADDGSFHTVLPLVADDAYWSVGVESPLLQLKRSIPDARLTVNAEGVARLDVDLPGSRLTGRVIDVDGKPVEHGYVNVTSEGGAETLLQFPIDAGGEFDANGLAPGAYSVRALMFDRRSSEKAEVTIGTDVDETRVTLKVAREREIKGGVESDAGPVPGATILAIPTDHLIEIYDQWTTDANGRFALILPNGAAECDFRVDAPGFAVRMFHRRVDGDTVAIRVEQRGGTLRVHLPAAQNDGSALPWLIHDGAMLSAFSVERRPRSLSDGTALLQNTYEPGAYSVCVGAFSERAVFLTRMPAGRCVTGLLAPFGELDLDLTFIAARPENASR